jgi:hypothetical protein
MVRCIIVSTGDDDSRTAGAIAVGETVLVRGTLRADKDFGSGYLDSVIVEEASIAKQ